MSNLSIQFYLYIIFPSLFSVCVLRIHLFAEHQKVLKQAIWAENRKLYFVIQVWNLIYSKHLLLVCDQLVLYSIADKPLGYVFLVWNVFIATLVFSQVYHFGKNWVDFVQKPVVLISCISVHVGAKSLIRILERTILSTLLYQNTTIFNILIKF